MKIQIYCSSLTGNTKKVALRLAEFLQAEGHEIHFTDILRETAVPSPADLILLCFWGRRSSMDYDSLKLLSSLHGETIAAIGTIGGDAAGAYGVRVREAVTQEVEKANTCAGVFLCQGKISEAKTEARRRLPKTDPHYLDDEHYARHLATRTHPDAADLDAAEEFVRQLIR